MIIERLMNKEIRYWGNENMIRLYPWQLRTEEMVDYKLENWSILDYASEFSRALEGETDRHGDDLAVVGL